MRFLPDSLCASVNVHSFLTLMRIRGISRGSLGVLVASAVIALGVISAPARADDDDYVADPIPANIEQVMDAYAVLGAVEDPVAREQRRQLLLRLLWIYGGNPWEIDPTWMIPMP